MKRFIRIHITNGERNIIGRLSYYTDSLTATPDEGVCKKALLRYGRRIDEVTLRFHSNGIIDKVYIENEAWDVKEQYTVNGNRINQLKKKYYKDGVGVIKKDHNSKVDIGQNDFEIPVLKVKKINNSNKRQKQGRNVITELPDKPKKGKKEGKGGKGGK